MKRKKSLVTYILIFCGLLLLVMVLTRSCFYSINQPFLRKTGKLIDKEKSEYYYGGYGFFKNNIYYWKNQAFGDTPEKLKNADKETFKVLSAFFAKDKNAVYFRSVADTNVDVSTFEVITVYDNPDDLNGSLVMKDQRHVYQLDDAVSTDENRVFKIVEGANPAYFQHIGNDWSKDDQNVFFRYRKVDADFNTFANLNAYFSKDRNFLYSVKKTPSADNANITISIEKIQCNGDELVRIPENSNYVRTKTAIYYNKDGALSGVQIKDTSSIETLYGDMWLKVSGKIVLYGAWFDKPGMDGKTFSSVGGDFFKDERHIYFWPLDTRNLIIIDNANIQTFAYVGGHYAKDINHVYYQNDIVIDANPLNFRYDEKSDYGYSGDNVYVMGKKKK